MTERQVQMATDEALRILRENPELSYKQAIDEAKKRVIGGEKNEG